MKNLFLSLLGIVLFSIYANAQSNFKPGYIVDLKGDTVKGAVDYREWDSNPSAVKFRKTGGEAENITSSDVLAFGIDGLDYYESYNLRISQGQTNVSNLSIGVDTTYKVAHVFLQRVAAGKHVSLYSYRDHIKNRFFVRENAEKQPVELVYRVYLDRANETQSVEQKKYQNQLYLLARKYDDGDEKVIKNIRYAGYDQSELRTIINAINHDAEPAGKRDKGTQFFAGLGLQRATATYTGYIAVAQNASGNASYSPVADLGVDLFVNPNVRKLVFRAELSFSTASITTTTSTPLFAQHSFSQANLSLTPQIIYNVYNTDKFKYYLGIGVAGNFSHYSRNTYHYAQEVYSGQTVEIPNYPQMASFWFSFPFRTGIVLNNKVEVYASYALYATITDHYETISGSVDNLRLGFNYAFK